MLKNLILIAIRNFKRDKWYSLINILGLTIGITFSLFLIFYIKHELSYDRYHKDADRIFRIGSVIKEPERDEMKGAATQFVLGPALQKDYPDVEDCIRLVNGGRRMFKKGELRLFEDKVFFADSNVFKVFTHRFLEGNPTTALVAPRSIVLTESVAQKYFGKKSPIGESLQDASGDAFTITGVMEDIPDNSHIKYSMLVSRSTLPADFAGTWGGFGFYTYVKLKPGVSAAAFEKKLLPMYDKYMASIFAQFNIKIKYVVQPITRIHLYSDSNNEPEELGSVSYIYIFSAVAFFMLIIACINYMNLTTARSSRRAKEIGIRKVTGSQRGQLIAQFLVESVLTALIAFVISLGLIAILLPMFNSLSGKSLTFSMLLEPSTLFLTIGVVIFSGLLGGSYPALYLSKFNPIDILKGSLSKGSSNVILRRVLVVFQFSVSMIMIICTWIVYSQLAYLRNKDLGFNKEQVLAVTVNSNRDTRSEVLAFTNAARNIPGVASVSTSQGVPGSGIGFNLFSFQTAKGFVEKGIDNYRVDENYFNTLGIKIAKGRGFSGPADTLMKIIVNEATVKEFGWQDEPIGKRVRFAGDTSSRFFEVVGVIKDFNQTALYNPIAPLMLFYAPNNGRIQLKLSSDKISNTVALIENSWKKHFADLPFQYNFLDQDFDSQYAADQNRGRIFTAFSILTIAITCLGLLGLIAFTTQQRQKEISIRKIMGAGMGEIIPLITKNFVLLVGISCLVAFPVAYLFMDKWLALFSYNTGMTALPFLMSALLVLVITMLTVMFHTIRAALANPAKSLRTE